MTLFLNPAAQTDPAAILSAIQARYYQKQSSLQLQLDVVNLKIQALTHRINALTDIPETVQMRNSCDQALRTAYLARERLLNEQASLKVVLAEAILLKDQMLQLDQTIQNLVHQIAERKTREQMLEKDIDELKALHCDIGSLTMLSGKWLLENETSTQALNVAIQKRKNVEEQIKIIILKAFKLCEQWGNDHLIGGSVRASDRQPDLTLK